MELYLPEDRTLGWGVIEWCTKWVLQPDGPNAGSSWRFTDEQARMVLDWYEIDDTGNFVYRRGVIRRMKGWGKDPLVAVLALAEACGPVLFRGWNSDGTPYAVPHPMPWIQIAAVSQEQTKNTMTLFPGMISPGMRKTYSIDPGKVLIYVRQGVGRIEAVTSSPSALEGNRSTLVILNESHLWVASNNGLEMANVIRRNASKARDGSGRSIEITNAHRPGEGSVAEGTYNAIKKGDVKGVWYSALEAPEVKDLTNHDAVIKALTIARGDSDWVNPERLFEEIQDPETPEYMARRFYLNHVVAVDIDRWLPQGAWAKCSANWQHIGEGERVVIALDGTYNGDSTALIACSVDLKIPHFEKLGVWEKPIDKVLARDWVPPREVVIKRLRDAMQYYRVQEVSSNPALWQGDLEALTIEGFPIATVQMKGQWMVDATVRLYEMVTGGRCTHNEDADMNRHFAAACVKDPLNPRLMKETGDSPAHIDLAVGCVIAAQRAAEIGMEDEYATVLFTRDSVPEQERDPKKLTEKDYHAPNQFNIGPKR